MAAKRDVIAWQTDHNQWRIWCRQWPYEPVGVQWSSRRSLQASAEVAVGILDTLRDVHHQDVLVMHSK